MLDIHKHYFVLLRKNLFQPRFIDYITVIPALSTLCLVCYCN